jgi:hypothetical protein
MIVVKSQNVIDIAVQESGSVLCALDWALLNNLSITDVLIAGATLINPDSDNENTDITNYFRNRKQLIATDIPPNPPRRGMSIGIGTMEIGTTFIVSP